MELREKLAREEILKLFGIEGKYHSKRPNN